MWNDEGALRLACKLIMEDYNRWQDRDDDNQRCMLETELAESEICLRLVSMAPLRT